MSPQNKQTHEPNPQITAAELVSDVASIVTTVLNMGATLTRTAAEATSRDQVVRPPAADAGSINRMLHYSMATASNMIRFVLPTLSLGAPAPTVHQRDAPTTAAARSGAPTISIPQARRGQSLKVPLMIENPHGEPMHDMAFHCLSIITDTLADGQILRRDAVQLEPSVLTVQPGDFEKLTLYLDVPQNTAPGRYDIAIGLPEEDFEINLPVDIV